MSNSRAAVILILLACVSPCFATTRHYYIAAEDVPWNYAPSGNDLLVARPIRPPWHEQLEWPKTRFIEYTDDTFTAKKPQPDWLGILGPIIRAEVGDEILVHFLNRTKMPRNMHAHGLHYDKNNEGSFYLPFGRGDRVAPGQKYVYHWFANEASGPGPNQPSSIVWWYHGHVDPGAEVNAGLLGPIIVTAKGKAKPDGSPQDVDREFVTSFQIFDERAGKPEGLFYAINGFIFGNLPGLQMKEGEKVRWHLLAMGNEIDLHSPHWHGETVTYEGRHTDVVELLPASMKTVDMIADNPGTWMFHCHVEDHMELGMMAVFTIAAKPTRPCPIIMSAGDFWHPGNLSLTVKNTTSKPIASVTLVTEMFLTPQDLRRPYNQRWNSTQAIAPGQEVKLNQVGYTQESEQRVMGWALYPASIRFADGSLWHSRQEGECFATFWRDEPHPEVLALPPVQVEINPD